jgi:Tol biopolymer transport system component
MNRSLASKLILLVILISTLQINVTLIQAQSSISSAELITRVTNAYGAFSPDGEKIAYMSNADGDFDIYVRYLDERTVIQLTDAPDRDGTPVWSPDGKRIAYASEIGDNTRIFIMNADGTNKIQISDDSPTDDRQPSWHSNGKSLLFSRYVWFKGNVWYEASEIYITRISN